MDRVSLVRIPTKRRRTTRVLPSLPQSFTYIHICMARYFCTKNRLSESTLLNNIVSCRLLDLVSCIPTKRQSTVRYSTVRTIAPTNIYMHRGLCAKKRLSESSLSRVAVTRLLEHASKIWRWLPVYYINSRTEEGQTNKNSPVVVVDCVRQETQTTAPTPVGVV